MVKKTVAQKAVVHEVGTHAHRVALISPEGNTTGEWAPINEIATCGPYHAVVEHSVLPRGVFTVRAAQHQVLR